MISMCGRQVSIVILLAIGIHLGWAVLVTINPEAVNATALNAIYRYIPSASLLVVILVVVAVMALVGILSRRPSRSWPLLIPQQILLMMSAAGAVEASWLGQFADGILRGHAFIAADQEYSMLAAICHTVAVVMQMRRAA